MNVAFAEEGKPGVEGMERNGQFVSIWDLPVRYPRGDMDLI